MLYSNLTRKLFKSIMISTLLIQSFTASAALTTVSIIISGENDCSGYFGTGFDNCEITSSDSDETLATSIGKIDADSEVYENNGNNDTTKGDLVYRSGQDLSWDGSGSLLSADSKTGTWKVLADDFPPIMFWAAKGGNGFKLFWMVDEVHKESGGVCKGNNAKQSLYACMSKAEIVTIGTWTTPKINGKRKGLSHLSFYGGCTQNCADTQTTVSEPASIALVSLALIGIASRRRKAQR